MGTGENKTPSATAYPYSSATRGRQFLQPRRPSHILKWFAPVALLFAVGGFSFTLWWSRERAKEGPCVDCKRQQEIVKELYFNKQVVHKSNRF